MLHKSLGRILGRSVRQFSVLTQFTTESVGEGFDRRIFISKNGKRISPWHSISLRADQKNVFNCVFEIARQELPKMEVTLDQQHNPIKQDLLKRDGNVRLREYGMPPLFNYGMMPQTWENEKTKDPKYGLQGDNDPLDVVEIGNSKFGTGAVVQVRVLGALCLIDQGELDWKILVVNNQEFNKDSKLKSLESIQAAYPDKLQAIIEWFRKIKTYDGKKENTFGYDEKWLGEAEALQVIEDNQKEYNRLIKGEIDNEWKFVLN